MAIKPSLTVIFSFLPQGKLLILTRDVDGRSQARFTSLISLIVDNIALSCKCVLLFSRFMPLRPAKSILIFTLVTLKLDIVVEV